MVVEELMKGVTMFRNFTTPDVSKFIFNWANERLGTFVNIPFRGQQLIRAKMWYGDIKMINNVPHRQDYRFPGVKHMPKMMPWPHLLTLLRNLVKQHTGIDANNCIATHYTPRAGIGAHQDKHDAGEFAVFSAGATRVLDITTKDGVVVMSIPLEAGSLIYISKEVNGMYYHGIKGMGNSKKAAAHGDRYSFVFRHFDKYTPL